MIQAVIRPGNRPRKDEPMKRTARVSWGLVLLPLVLAADAARVPPKGWKEYRPRDQSFVAWLPDGGKVSERGGTVPLRGTRVRLYQVHCQVKGGPAYSAARLTLSDLLARKLPRKERIELFRDTFVEALAGEISKEKDVKQGRHPAKEYWVKTDKGLARIRLFTVGTHVYQAMVSGTRGQVESADAATFLDSFALPTQFTAASGGKDKEPSAGKDGGKPEPVDLARVKIPATPAAGKILGADFKVDGASLGISGMLTLRQGKGLFPAAAVRVLLPDRSVAALQGKIYQVGSGKPSGGKPIQVHLLRTVKGEELPRVQTFRDGFTLKLEFGKAAAGKVPGKIYVRVADEAGSFVAGTFHLEIK